MCFLVLNAAWVAASASTASATTQGICYGMSNVPPSDALNLRAQPNAGAPILARFVNSSEVIFGKAGPCRRWCRVSASTASGTKFGWINARYLRTRECP
jgi:hypothetical protein